MGNKLRAAREKKGLSVKELAFSAKIKVETYYKYESGARFPSRKVMLRLATALSEPIADLFFADE